MGSALRDFIRNHVFESFPLFAGVCLGIAQATLLAWVGALRGGLDAVPVGTVALAAGVLVAGNGALMPRVGLARPRSRALAWLEQAYLAIGFSTIVVGGAVVAFSLVFALGVPLLAVAGLAPELGLTLFRVGSVAVAAGVAGALGFGFWVAPRRLDVTTLRIPIRGLPEPLHGLRIAQLSDLHVGNGLEGRRLAAIVDRSNALAADLVVITGDLFDHDPSFLGEGGAELARLRAPLGVFAVLGNHDVMTGCDVIAEALAKNAPGVRLLRDEWHTLATQAPLHLAGVEDPGRDWTEHGRGLAVIDELSAAIPGEGLRILLVHRPDAFPQAAAAGYGLVLSGHFHGGQLALPVAEGRWNAARLLSSFHRGLYRIGDSTLYVSRGLGFAGPRIRFGADPEIAVLELAPDDR